MRNYYQRHPRIAVAFFLVPIVFNLIMWQNYPVSAQCLIPDWEAGLGMTNALMVFGFGFGLLTSLFVNTCALAFVGIGTVLKNKTLVNHVKRFRGMFATFWVVGFTAGSFAGFLLIICLRETANTNIFFSGLQGFIIAGMGGGVGGVIVASVLSALIVQVKKSFPGNTKAITAQSKSH